MRGERAAVERVFREGYGRLIASLTGRFVDIAISEEAADGALAALQRRPESGVPALDENWPCGSPRRLPDPAPRRSC